MPCTNLRARGADTYIYIYIRNKTVSWGQTASFLFIFYLLSVFLSFTFFSLVLLSFFFSLSFFSLPFWLQLRSIDFPNRPQTPSPVPIKSLMDLWWGYSRVVVVVGNKPEEGCFLFCFCEHLRKCMLGQRSCSVGCAMDAIRR